MYGPHTHIVTLVKSIDPGCTYRVQVSKWSISLIHYYTIYYSYATRLWAPLISKPQTAFDISVPEYIEPVMDILSQVFVECFTQTSSRVNKVNTYYRSFDHAFNQIYYTPCLKNGNIGLSVLLFILPLSKLVYFYPLLLLHH